jgi:hypothetical protein
MESSNADWEAAEASLAGQGVCPGTSYTEDFCSFGTLWKYGRNWREPNYAVGQCPRCGGTGRI